MQNSTVPIPELAMANDVSAVMVEYLSNVNIHDVRTYDIMNMFKCFKWLLKIHKYLITGCN